MQHVRGMSGGKTKFACHALDKMGEPLDIRRIQGLVQWKAKTQKPGDIIRIIQSKVNPVIVVIRMGASVMNIGMFAEEDDHIRLCRDAVILNMEPCGSLNNQEKIFRKAVFVFNVAGKAVV